jgi:hypothetical protein
MDLLAELFAEKRGVVLRHLAGDHDAHNYEYACKSPEHSQSSARI